MKKTALSVIATLLVAAGCASTSGGPSSGQPFVSPGPTTVRLVVQNRNFQDARLYTYRRGTRAFLGIVAGKQDKQFVLDWDFPDPMYIEIDMLAGPRCYTEEMQVDPGDVLELQIAAVFTSTAACRR
jgi:hypothetical protein